MSRQLIGPTSRRGFSLLETIVAVSILMITIVGPLSLASKGIVFSDYVKDEITGFYLAQEGMEAVRNIRDENIKNLRSWLTNLEPCTDGRICHVDIWNYSSPTRGVTECLSCTGDTLDQFVKLRVVNVGDNTGAVKLYGYDFHGGILGSTQPEYSIFSRKISIKRLDYSKIAGIQPGEIQSTRVFDPKGDEVNVTVEVSWIRANASSATNLQTSKIEDRSSTYTERKVQVSENMFNF